MDREGMKQLVENISILSYGDAPDLNRYEIARSLQFQSGNHFSAIEKLLHMTSCNPFQSQKQPYFYPIFFADGR